MKNAYSYLQQKSIQGVACSIAYLVTICLTLNYGLTSLEIHNSPFNALVCCIVAYCGYKVLLNVITDKTALWGEKVYAFCYFSFLPSYVICLILYFITKETQINNIVDNWILHFMGKDACNAISGILFGAVLIAILVHGMSSTLTDKPFLQSVWEKCWYLTNNAPNSEKGETWIFHKNGKLTITSPLKGNKDLTETYTWKYNPQMKSIAIVAEQRTQIFLNISVSESELAFTTSQPDSLYIFSILMPISKDVIVTPITQ